MEQGLTWFRGYNIISFFVDGASQNSLRAEVLMYFLVTLLVDFAEAILKFK